MDIKKGSVVRLKSCGPRMTVKGIGSEFSETAVVCDWFSGDDRLDGWFEIDQLELDGDEDNPTPRAPIVR